MAMQDEAGGGGGAGGAHNRVIFFEIVAGTRLLKDGMKIVKNEFQQVAASWKQMQTGMTAENAKALTTIDDRINQTVRKQMASMDELKLKTTAAMQERVASAEKAAAQEEEAVAIMVAQQVETYEAAYKQIEEANALKVADIEAKAKEEADSQIRENNRAFENQKKNILALREEMDTQKSPFFGRPGTGAFERAAGISNIGTAVALAGAGTTQIRGNEAASTQHSDRVNAVRQETSQIVAIEEANKTTLTNLARQTASDQITAIHSKRDESIRTAQEEGAGVIQHQQEQDNAIVQGMQKQRKEIADTESGWKRFQGALGSVLSTITAAAVAIPLLGGVLGVLFGVLQSTTKAVSDWAAEIVQASEATGLSYTMVQGYLTLVEHFGVSHLIAETILVRFNKRLQENGGLLNSLGINAKTADQAFLQFADGISKSATPLAYINQVLGGTVRSGSMTAFVDAMKKIGDAAGGAKAGMEAWISQMNYAGFLLDDATVKAGALSEAISTQLGMAFEGMKMRIGAVILPEMQAMETVLIALISGTDQTGKHVGVLTDFFSNLARWIAQAMGYLIGFIAGIAGIKQADLDAIFTNAANAASVLAGETEAAAQHTADLKQEIKDLGVQQKNLEIATRQQTEAIDNQIAALQKNQKTFDDAHNDKIQALRDEKTNYEDQLKIMDDLHQSYLTQLQDQLNALKDTQDSRRQSGEDLASYETRLAEQGLQKQITNEQDRRNLVTDTMQQKIDLTEQTEKAIMSLYDETTQNQINNLNDQKRALQDHLTDMQAQIQAQIQKDQNELTGAADDVTKTVKGTTSGLADAISTAVAIMHTTAVNGGLTAGQGFIGNFVSMFQGAAGLFEKVGEDLGGQIMSGILSSAVMSSGLGFIAAQLTGDSTKIMLAAVNALGKATSIDQVNAIAGAAIHSNMLDDQERNTVNNTAQAVAQNLIAANKQGASVGGLVSSLLSSKPKYGPAFAAGGIINSPVFGATLGESGREVVLPLTNPRRTSQLMQEAGIGGHTFVTNFNGPVATGQVADIVVARMASEAKRKGLILGAGL